MERDVANFRVIDQRLKIKRGAMCTACGLAISPDFRSVAQVDGESIIHAGILCFRLCRLFPVSRQSAAGIRDRDHSD